jgi:hypothetical protein
MTEGIAFFILEYVYSFFDVAYRLQKEGMLISTFYKISITIRLI